MSCSLFTYCVVGVTNLDEENKMSKLIDEKKILRARKLNPVNIGSYLVL